MAHLDPFTLLLIALVSMLFSGFFSGMEIAFVSSNRIRVEIDAKRGGIVNRIIHLFYTHSDNFISTLLVGNNIVNVIYGMAMGGLLLVPLRPYMAGNDFLLLLCQTLISTLIILITGEFLPKTIFRINPNHSLRMFAVPLLVIYRLLWPIAKFTELLSSQLMRLLGIDNRRRAHHIISVNELDNYLQENIDTQEEQNIHVDREVKLFENALDFSDTQLRDCMIPRNEIVAVDIAQTEYSDLVKLFSSTGLSKIVVYYNDVDHVLGFIQVSEMFRPYTNWKDCIKPVIFAPENMLAKYMMQRLLTEKKSMAIAIDEFGGTSGLVTLEDLVEEIFGDIQDEHDKNRLTMKQIDEHHFEVSGRVEIEDLNEHFHLGLPESDDYHTIAGYLISNLEAIPNEGTKHHLQGYTFTVTKKTGARLELIHISTAQEGEPQV